MDEEEEIRVSADGSQKKWERERKMFLF